MNAGKPAERQRLRRHCIAPVRRGDFPCRFLRRFPAPFGRSAHRALSSVPFGEQGRYGGDGDHDEEGGNSSMNEETGLSEETSMGCSRSTSEDAIGSNKSHSEEKIAVHQHATKQRVKQRVSAVEAFCDAASDGVAVEGSDDGEDGDMEDDEFEEDENLDEEEEDDEDDDEHAAEHAVIVPDFDDVTFEASTRSSKEHDARVSRIVETCFPGHGLIPFERLYRSSWPISSITGESLLLRDHLLLPKSVATKVSLPCPMISRSDDLRCLEKFCLEICHRKPGLGATGFSAPGF